MTDANTVSPADTAGASLETTSPNVDTTTIDTTATTDTTTDQTLQAQPEKPAYTPNFKYKAANQEKELDPLFHSLIKDQDSEKKVKEIFSKVDAFDYIKQKKEHAETQHDSLLADYNQVQSTVQRFNESVQNNDLSSAFRLAGITKEQIFKWTQQQLQLMEMPPEQRQQYEQFEQAKQGKFELEQRVQQIQQQYQTQAVQNRAMQLDMALSRPQVASFAEKWDQNGEPGSFRNFVIEEAKKVYYDTQQDLSPDQAVNLVMQRFGKFLNVGDTTMQSPQAVPQGQRANPPVIPNVTGKAASPIKKVPRSIDDLRKLAKEARD